MRPADAGGRSDGPARPTAEQLRDLLNNLQLDPNTPQPPPTVYRSAGTFVAPRPRPVPPTTPTRDDETPPVHTRGRKGFVRKWFFGG